MEVGKVTLKINGDEALSDKSVLKSTGDKALNSNILDLLGWIRNFAIRKFAKFHTFLIS